MEKRLVRRHQTRKWSNLNGRFAFADCATVPAAAVKGRLQLPRVPGRLSGVTQEHEGSHEQADYPNRNRRVSSARFHWGCVNKWPGMSFEIGLGL
jgi:hypothetical protein